MKSFLEEFNTAAKDGARMYFAPVIGAVKAVKAEIRLSQMRESSHQRAAKDTDLRKSKDQASSAISSSDQT